MLKRNEIDELCLQGESSGVDFKREQYLFVKGGKVGIKYHGFEQDDYLIANSKNGSFEHNNPKNGDKSFA